MKGKHVVMLLVLCALMVPGSKTEAQVAEYLDATVIVKIDPTLAEKCGDTSIYLPAVMDILQGFEVSRIQKKFPWLEAPEPLRSPQSGGEVDRRVDLSTIYEITYGASADPHKVAGALSQLDEVVYAEPWFIPRLCVIPSDQLVDSMWHLPIIRAFEAWDIDTGSANITIAIVDTGVDWDHPDLAGAIKINALEIPDNGLDDDNNGFIDDVRGWNFFNDNNDPNETGFSHGTHVAGLAGAVTNNDFGVAGVSWCSKVLAVKAGDKLQIPYGYDGVVYAADNGADIINCSWGSFGASLFAHDVIKYATYNHDALVVGGAGNDNRENLFFPASYPEVVSVGASDPADLKSDFSNFNYHIDLIAPGSKIFSLKNDTFGWDSGTSMASPIVAGAAALVRHRFPELTALQVREQLRVSAEDSIYDRPLNAPYAAKLGTGRLDVFKAVESIASPALRIDYHEFSDGDDEIYVEGDELSLGVELVNFLLPMSDITLTVESMSPYIEVLNGTWNLGDLPQNGRLNNLVNPFDLQVLSIDGNDKVAVLKLEATSPNTSYKMVEYLTVVVNPSYVNIMVNDVKTTVSPNGLVGYTDLYQTYGLGFQLENQGSLLYEAGLMIGHENWVRIRVADRIRSKDVYDHDFVTRTTITRQVPTGEEAYLARGSFDDSAGMEDKIGLMVEQRATAYTEEGHRNYVLIEYTIENQSGEDLEDMCVGMFADWDISNASTNRAETAFGKRLGFAYHTGSEKITAGIQAFGDYSFASYMIDNVVGGYGGIDLYDSEDFSSRRKYKAMTNNRFTAGAAGEDGRGNDVIQVASMYGINLKAGEKCTLAFALHAGRNKEAVLVSADSAYRRYYGHLPGENLNQPFELRNIWPVPGTGEINLDVDMRDNGSLEIYIYSVHGTLVHTQSFDNLYAGFNEISFRLPELAPGSYLLESRVGNYEVVKPILFIQP